MDMRKFSATGIKEPYYIMLSGTNRRASCRGCIYRRGIGSRGDRYSMCCYCYDTGIPRGCHPEKCDKKKVKKYHE